MTLADMGMTRMMGGTAPLGAHLMLRAVPATVPAGKVSLIAENRGWRTHELVILPLAAGDQAGQRVPGPDGTVEEKGSMAEASASCGAGAGEGIRAGTVSWTTLTLAPGTWGFLPRGGRGGAGVPAVRAAMPAPSISPADEACSGCYFP